jgi:long-chain acyl-CoA synthetase
LSALVTGDVTLDSARAAIGEMNSGLPHYRQIRAFHIQQAPLTVESGLLTANGKLRRDAIATRFRDAIESMYRKGARI